MNKVLIIDGNNYCYKAYYAYNKLNHKGKLSNVIYGVVTMVESMIKELKPNKVIFIVDRNRHDKRIEVLPDYKGKRTTKIGFEPESFFEQRNDTCILLSQGFGITTIAIPGQEADDLIYKEVKALSKDKKNHIYIASTDKDFHQLITDNVFIYSAKKDKIILTPNNLKTHFKYNPNQVVDYLCLIGDDSDNIPGYKGIGEVKALSFVNLHSIKDFLKSDVEFKGIDKSKLEEVYNRNRVLIDLKYFNRKFNKDKNVLKNEYSVKQFNEEVIKDLSISYGINMFRTKIFQKTFKELK
jgi:DNA polymerase-1